MVPHWYKSPLVHGHVPPFCQTPLPIIPMQIITLLVIEKTVALIRGRSTLQFHKLLWSWRPELSPEFDLLSGSSKPSRLLLWLWLLLCIQTFFFFFLFFFTFLLFIKIFIILQISFEHAIYLIFFNYVLFLYFDLFRKGKGLVSSFCFFPFFLSPYLHGLMVKVGLILNNVEKNKYKTHSIH